MHSVFLIDEILRAIFSEIRDDDGTERRCHNTFASLATVCRAWNGPALDFLWECLPSTDPLVALLPTVNYDNGTYSFTDDPTLNDLTNLAAYASRVRSIHHSGRPSAKFLSQVLGRLIIAQHGDFLLPALTTLSLHLTDPARRTLAPTLYLSTRLRSVSIDVGFVRRGAHPGESLCAFVDGLATVAQRLECVSLRGRSGERILEAIASMTKLRSLSLCIGNEISPRVLAALGSFPHLQDLRLQLDGMEAESLCETLTSAASRFASLETLRVRGAPETLEVLLKSFPERCCLRTVQLESDLKPRSVDAWTPLLSLLASKARYTLQNISLEAFTAFCEVPNLAVPPKIHFTVSTFAPLAVVSGLRSFKLDASVPADLNDADIMQLTRWWPNIEQLLLWTQPAEAFDYPTYFTMQPRATPNSLCHLASACPSLRTLSLPLDIAASHSTPTIGEAKPQTALRNITIGCVKKGCETDAHGLAARLFAAFPHLASIELQCGDEEPWTTLEEAYAALQDAAQSTLGQI